MATPTVNFSGVWRLVRQSGVQGFIGALKAEYLVQDQSTGAVRHADMMEELKQYCGGNLPSGEEWQDFALDLDESQVEHIYATQELNDVKFDTHMGQLSYVMEFQVGQGMTQTQMPGAGPITAIATWEDDGRRLQAQCDTGSKTFFVSRNLLDENTMMTLLNVQGSSEVGKKLYRRVATK